LIALAQRTGFDGVLYLLHELEVEWNAGGLVQPKDHQSVLVRWYTIHIAAGCQEMQTAGGDRDSIP
jgi:hypothetical protein